MLSFIGKTLYLDIASIQKTRESVAKVRLQMDITKEKPPHIWMGTDESDFNIGRWQAIQYEGLPNYYVYCKNQGHLEQDCNVKLRDEEEKKRKDVQKVKNNTPDGILSPEQVCQPSSCDLVNATNVFSVDAGPKMQ